jgi:hypothetical protein
MCVSFVGHHPLFVGARGLRVGCIALLVGLAMSHANAGALAVNRETSSPIGTEPSRWDRLLILLLRLLYELYGGDPDNIPEDGDAVAAMALIKAHYDENGTPEFSPLERAAAREIIKQCQDAINACPCLTDEPYQAFLQTLEAMDQDLGGTLDRCDR